MPPSSLYPELIYIFLSKISHVRCAQSLWHFLSFSWFSGRVFLSCILPGLVSTRERRRALIQENICSVTKPRYGTASNSFGESFRNPASSGFISEPIKLSSHVCISWLWSLHTSRWNTKRFLGSDQGDSMWAALRNSPQLKAHHRHAVCSTILVKRDLRQTKRGVRLWLQKPGGT